MTLDSFDLIVIGSGPGGYVASVRASQLGMKTACIEKHEKLGGVCLNVGCIPSKALLDSSEYYHLAKDHFAEHGIRIKELSLDLSAMMARKNQVVNDLTDQVRKLLERHRISIFRGKARLIGKDRVSIEEPTGTSRSIQGRNILLATGSEPIQLPGLVVDGHRIVDSTGALSFKTVPERLVVVGGGYIGLELGSVWNRLGSQVTVVEMLPKIGTTLDGQIARTLDRLLKQQGIQFRMNTKVINALQTGTSVKLTLEHQTTTEIMECDRVLVAVGRRPNTRGIGLEDVGVKIDPRTGWVIIDETFQTSVPGIYAIGDIVPGPMLAHKASAEGIAAVECMKGLPGEVNYDAIPSIIYTWPEVASVGLTEEQVKERGIPYCVGTYPFSGAGRARCMGEKDGFVKIIVNSKTDRILGAHIIGPRAADMIAECVLAIEFGASSEDIARTVHGHPTFAEALQEAALAARKCSIYAS